MVRPAKKLYEVIDSLPEDKKREVLDFAEYLRFREVERAGLTAQVTEAIKQAKNKKVRPARDLLNEL